MAKGRKKEEPVEEKVVRRLKGVSRWVVSFPVTSNIDIIVEASETDTDEARDKAEKVLEAMDADTFAAALLEGFNSNGEIDKPSYVYNLDTGEEWCG